MTPHWSDPRWEAGESERRKAIEGLNSAIYALAGLAADKDSPYSSSLQQRFAEAVPKLTWIRSELSK